MSLDNLSTWDNPDKINEWLEYEQAVAALAFYLNVSETELIAALQLRGQNDYQTFSINKRSGEKRKIVNPNLPLKQIQKAVQQKIYEFGVNAAAKGCVPGQSTKSNAKPHRKSDYFIKLDISRAFPSVTGEMLDQLFSKLLQTKFPTLEQQFPKLTNKDKEVFKNLLLALVLKDNELPQGTSTSPYLFNLAFKAIDEEISRIIKASALVNPKYTRYVDDITISGSDLKEIDSPEAIQNELENIQHQIAFACRNAGLEVNTTKSETTVLTPDAQSTNITGINVTYSNRLEISERSQNKYLKILSKIADIMGLVKTKKYSDLMDLIATESFQELFDSKSIGDLTLFVDYENDTGIIWQLSKQINRAEAYFKYVRSVMNHLPRPLNKAYRTLEQNYPELWNPQFPESLVPSLATILHLTDPEATAENFSNNQYAA